MKSSTKNKLINNAETSASGKKLVQARLPFKILSSPVVDDSTPKSDSLKRKLIYPQKCLDSNKISRNLDVKESVLNEDNPVEISDDETETSKQNSVLLKEDGTISLPDNFNEELPDHNLDPCDKSSDHRGDHKLHIKLPLSVKKRKKSPRCTILKAAECNDDAEVVKQNPAKKVKVDVDIICDKEKIPEVCVIEIDDDEDEGNDNLSLSEDQCDPKDQNDVDETQAAAESGDLIALQSTEVLDDSESNFKIVLSESSDQEALEEILSDENSDEPISSKNSESCIEIARKTENSEEDEEAHADTFGQHLLNLSKVDQKSLTPKQVQKMKDREEKLQQRQKEKEDKERLRKKEREEKEEQRRKEKEEKEEQKRKEKEEKEEQRRKEKEEKEKRRLAEIEAKNEERRQKEEERKKREEWKEEERKKKEEERKKKEQEKEEERKKKEQEKEEAENKKRKAAQAFTKFFVTSKGLTKSSEDVDADKIDSCKVKNLTFMPFEVKVDMKLAPLSRRTLTEEEKSNLTAAIEDNGNCFPRDKLYLQSLKSRAFRPRKYRRTWLMDDAKTNDCIIIDELEDGVQKIDDINNPVEKYRAKYFLFEENRRPPYYGTWRKTSSFVKPRRPFATDTGFFDYEVDSDDEWEEEEPGESLHGSDDEKESEDEYDVDNEFMVPHGHLSDEELGLKDELEEDNSPEIQKAKLKIKQLEFAQEMKKKTEKIKPRIIGIVWADENGNKPASCPTMIWDSLLERAMIFSKPISLDDPKKSDSEKNSPTQEKKLRNVPLSDDHIKDLIKLVHGNIHKKVFLINEFFAFIKKDCTEETPNILYTRRTVKDKLKKIAEWTIMEDETKKKNKKKLSWLVKQDVLEQYGMADLGLVNSWKYTLQPRLREENNTEKLTEIKHKIKPLDGITRFTKKISKNKESTTAEISKPDDNSSKVAETERTEGDAKENQVSSLLGQPVEPISIVDTGLASSSVTQNSTAECSFNPAPVKKRVPLLMSVPRGQSIPEAVKNTLISNFLKKTPSDKKDPPQPMDVEVVVLD